MPADPSDHTATRLGRPGALPGRIPWAAQDHETPGASPLSQILRVLWRGFRAHNIGSVQTPPLWSQVPWAPGEAGLGFHLAVRGGTSHAYSWEFPPPLSTGWAASTRLVDSPFPPSAAFLVSDSVVFHCVGRPELIRPLHSGHVGCRQFPAFLPDREGPCFCSPGPCADVVPEKILRPGNARLQVCIVVIPQPAQSPSPGTAPSHSAHFSRGHQHWEWAVSSRLPPGVGEGEAASPLQTAGEAGESPAAVLC